MESMLYLQQPCASLWTAMLCSHRRLSQSQRRSGHACSTASPRTWSVMATALLLMKEMIVQGSTGAWRWVIIWKTLILSKLCWILWLKCLMQIHLWPSLLHPTEASPVSPLLPFVSSRCLWPPDLSLRSRPEPPPPGCSLLHTGYGHLLHRLHPLHAPASVSQDRKRVRSKVMPPSTNRQLEGWVLPSVLQDQHWLCFLPFQIIRWLPSSSCQSPSSSASSKQFLASRPPDRPHTLPNWATPVVTVSPSSSRWCSKVLPGGQPRLDLRGPSGLLQDDLAAADATVASCSSPRRCSSFALPHSGFAFLRVQLRSPSNTYGMHQMKIRCCAFQMERLCVKMQIVYASLLHVLLSSAMIRSRPVIQHWLTFGLAYLLNSDPFIWMLNFS